MTVVVRDPDLTVYHADVLEALAGMEDCSVDCVATSPPYWGLRDYGTGDWTGGDPACEHKVREDARVESSTLGGGKSSTGHQQEGYGGRCGRCGATRVDRQLGLEPTPAAYVESLVTVFHEIRRVLADHGVVWLNLGDSYVSQPRGNAPGDFSTSSLTNPARQDRVARPQGATSARAGRENADSQRSVEWQIPGLKAKDLVGIPWRVAFGLQDDGWWLRSENIWDKCNPLPESVKDRPTKAHEQVFLLSKNARYFYDRAAVLEPAEWARWGDQTTPKYDGVDNGSGWIKARSKEELKPWPGIGKASHEARATLSAHGHDESEPMVASASRNMRSVWRIPTSPNTWAACKECDAVFETTKDAERHRTMSGHDTTGHFAAFPPDLVRRCILAGCPTEVCTACGKPRERVEERTFYGDLKTADNKDGGRDLERGFTRNELGGQKKWAEYEPPRTVGFSDCGCGAPYRQGVVLDPFLGSGTTAIVAREEGRACVGIELSEPYTRIVRTRLQQQSLFPELA